MRESVEYEEGLKEKIIVTFKTMIDVRKKSCQSENLDIEIWWKFNQKNICDWKKDVRLALI